MKLQKFFSLSLAVIFAVVGLIFLMMPDGVLTFFNTLSKFVGLPPSPVQGVNFFLILAVGYMYLVTLLAYSMFKYPGDQKFPLLLANGKFASAILSFYLFLLHKPYLIYIANGIVDGLIGILVLFIYFRIKKVTT